MAQLLVRQLDLAVIGVAMIQGIWQGLMECA